MLSVTLRLGQDQLLDISKAKSEHSIPWSKAAGSILSLQLTTVHARPGKPKEHYKQKGNSNHISMLKLLKALGSPEEKLSLLKLSLATNKGRTHVLLFSTAVILSEMT